MTPRPTRSARTSSGRSPTAPRCSTRWRTTRADPVRGTAPVRGRATAAAGTAAAAGIRTVAGTATAVAADRRRRLAATVAARRAVEAGRVARPRSRRRRPQPVGQPTSTPKPGNPDKPDKPQHTLADRTRSAVPGGRTLEAEQPVARPAARARRLRRMPSGAPTSSTCSSSAPAPRGRRSPMPRARPTSSGRRPPRSCSTLARDRSRGLRSARSGRLDAVVISHLHPDHFIDLVALRHYLAKLETPRRVRVHRAGGARRAPRRAPRRAGLQRGLARRRAASARPRSGIGDLRLEARRVTHTDQLAFRVSTASTARASSTPATAVGPRTSSR